MIIEHHHNLIVFEVMTETGVFLGWVRDMKCNLRERTTFIITAYPNLHPAFDKIVSTCEVSVNEVYSIHENRLIVFEGTEERLNQLTTGILDRFGWAKPPWKQIAEEDCYRISTGFNTKRFGDDDDYIGGVSPSPRPRTPKPSPKTNDAEAWP